MSYKEDIVSRLRIQGQFGATWPNDAADEIESLRKQVKDLESQLKEADDEVIRLENQGLSK